MKKATVIRDTASTIATTHYHVLAIHDWGGSHQCDHGWDDQWSMDDAKKFADTVIIADTERDVFGVYRSYTYSSLRSCNVAPGYDVVWIVECGCDSERCHDEIFTRPECQLGKPYWSASTTPREYSGQRLVYSAGTNA